MTNKSLIIEEVNEGFIITLIEDKEHNERYVIKDIDEINNFIIGYYTEND